MCFQLLPTFISQRILSTGSEVSVLAMSPTSEPVTAHNKCFPRADYRLVSGAIVWNKELAQK